MPKNNKTALVHIEHAPPNNIESSVGKCLDGIGWKKIVPKGAKVGIKVNVGWDRFVPGCTTSPRVVAGIIKKLEKRVSKIDVIEINSLAHDATKGFEVTGFKSMAGRLGVNLLNLTNDSYKAFKIKLRGNVVLLKVASSLFDYDVFVTAPVFKTHGLTTFTGAIKNQWGCIKKTRFLFHLEVDQFLAELNSIIKPHLAVGDGTIVMEGQGPKLGEPRRLDLVMASKDIVAMDSVASYIFGFDPQKIYHFKNCERKGIGIADIKKIRVNKDLDRLRFRCKPAGGLSYGDFPRMIGNFILKHKILKLLCYGTPILEIIKRGYAKYNDLWYITIGRGRGKNIIKNYKYFY